MGKITSIKAQAKNQNRLSIYVDEVYSFSLSMWQLSDLKVGIGDQVTDADIAHFKSESDLGKLQDKTIVWLTLRPRSTWELQDYLLRKTDDEEMRDSIVERFKQRGYLDDEDFARRWIQNRRLLKTMSKHRIKQELLKKRVPREIIESTLEEDEVDDSETVKILILKKRSKYKDDQKLMAFLARQGYSYGVIKQSLEELEEDSSP